ncbi:glycosyltransferase family 61 protein [Methylobacterium sp. J-076]|uniref:glycosyltransferase family 61 protein n=1 Tax=Methylobacterium sp. J-076 TaxID=2836655 RepID=UPI001FB9645A|nr:glycosyltransferase family 61 protein [Methylobacterium sp. J-076]MCJ2014638.1 glycosyltransferase family 61 protein [Methylobacterium sp. J-076]
MGASDSPTARPAARLATGLDPDCLVFSCAETAAGAQASFPGAADLYGAMLSRVCPRTRAVATLFPAYSYRRPAPRRLTGPDGPGLRALADWFGELDETYRRFPPTVLCETTDLRLGGNVLHYRENGAVRVLYETHRLSDLKMIEAIGLDGDRVDEHLAADGLYFLLCSVGSFNYGHWLVDDLPRLEGFFVLRRLHPGRTITILLPAYGAHMDEVRRRMIALYLGADEGWRAVFYDRERVYAVPRLYFATPCSQQPYGKSPEAVAAVRTRLLRQTRVARAESALRRITSPGSGRRLFVDRSGARGRTLVNRSDVVSAVERRGFEVIDPERYSPRQQIVKFARARVVVGLAGAAMVNTIFCPPQARILYIAPDRGWTDPFFWDLAAVCGHPYAAVHGRWSDREDTIARRDFSLSVPDLEAALDAL